MKGDFIKVYDYVNQSSVDDMFNITIYFPE